MHQLDRPPAPGCLSNYQHGRDNWGRVTPADKTKIWASLNVMQGNRCAYCECHIRTEPDSHHAHIEQRHRAEETIRIFNLNGSLRQIRETYVMGYRHTAEEFLALADEFDEDDWRPLLEQELKAIAGQAFETAIRHVLQID